MDEKVIFVCLRHPSETYTLKGHLPALIQQRRGKQKIYGGTTLARQTEELDHPRPSIQIASPCSVIYLKYILFYNNGSFDMNRQQTLVGPMVPWW